MEETLGKIQYYAVLYGLNLLAAIVIFIVGRWLAQFLSRLIENIMLNAKVDKTLALFIRHLVNVGMMAFVIIAAFNKLGIETTSVVAVIGAAGLAVGLALQGSLANFAAGVMLILFKPFSVGDAIEGGGTSGTVEEIQIFSTILTGPDNRKIVVPNSKLTGDIITNYSAVERRRIELVFSISYADDMQKAKEVLLNLLRSDARVLKDPAPFVAVKELAANSVDLICRPWVKPEEYWNVYFDLVEKGKLAIEKNGMSIPFPQRDVHLYSRDTQ